MSNNSLILSHIQNFNFIETVQTPSPALCAPGVELRHYTNSDTDTHLIGKFKTSDDVSGTKDDASPNETALALFCYQSNTMTGVCFTSPTGDMLTVKNSDNKGLWMDFKNKNNDIMYAYEQLTGLVL